ncbi:hypothetical protein LTR28_002139 [Elasticomyces elasticus]|nr:hypothetical protein LTR28_002139 [Elasticomyces elasticus]
MSTPGFFTEIMGHVAYAFAEVQPYIPMYTHLVLSALFPIYTAAFASLARPSSAAKPEKKTKRDAASDSENEEEDEIEQKMEGLSPSDAIVFPVLAGTTLTGLYFLIKWMGPETLNKILGWYFSIVGVASVSKLLSDGFAAIHSFFWPRTYVDQGKVWRVNSRSKSFVPMIARGISKSSARSSPLPGVFALVPLSKSVNHALWTLRETPKLRYTVKSYVYRLLSFRLTTPLYTILSAVSGLGLVLYSNLVDKPWWLTNLQGFAFSYSALQLLSPTTFATGSLILGALFFYDVYFVFFTPMMVTVAKNLDIPIKLLFPRPLEEGQDPTIRNMAMLGLGDIVLPGLMIGLALRFDLYLHYLKKQKRVSSAPELPGDAVIKAPFVTTTANHGDKFWTSSWTGRSLVPALATSATEMVNPSASDFRKPYFHASLAGYVSGMLVTLGVMQFSQHAQPALLYLVPGVLGSIWSTAVVRGELKEAWNFSEASEEEEEDAKKAKQKATEERGEEKKGGEQGAQTAEAEVKGWKAWFGKSFFGAEKQEKMAKRMEESLAMNTEQDPASDDESKGKRKAETVEKNLNEKEKVKKQDLFTRDRRNELFFFSISREPARSSQHSPTETPTSTTTSDTPGQPSTNEHAEATTTAPAPTTASTRSVSASSTSSDSLDAIMIGDDEVHEAQLRERKQRWRAGSDSEGRERAEKRLRTE